MDIVGDLSNVLVSDVANSALPAPELYQYYKNLKNRTIIVNDEINQSIMEWAVLPFYEMDNDGTGTPITILLNTVGGSLYDGMTLVDAIESAHTPTKIRIVGMAASMGLYIAMAGKNNPNVTTVCTPFSVGLMHGGSLALSDSSYAVKDQFDFLQHYEDKLKDYILSHCKIDEDMYNKVERREFWMDADDMLKYGIVDAIENN